jgi:hypothetical protein
MPALQPHEVPRSTRDDERLAEIRRLFDRYRRLARTADTGSATPVARAHELVNPRRWSSGAARR